MSLIRCLTRIGILPHDKDSERKLVKSSNEQTDENSSFGCFRINQYFGVLLTHSDCWFIGVYMYGRGKNRARGYALIGYGMKKVVKR